MGVLSSLRGSALCSACGRRRQEGAAASAPVCPVSGKAGFCPVSGKATAKGKAGPKPARVPSREEIERAAAHKERGNAHFKRGELQEALGAYNDALLLTERDPALWLNRSIVHRQLKRWEEARDDAEIAGGLDPSNAKAHYGRALALQELGKLKEALKAAEEGLRAEPENKALLQLRSVLKRAKAEAAAKDAKPVSGKDEPARQAAEEPDTLPSAALREQEEDSSEKCPVSKLKEADLREIRQVAERYEWKDREPNEMEREAMKRTMVEMFLSKYHDLKSARAEASGPSTLNTDQYEKEQKLGLQLTGGHRPMKRPDHVQLPSSFQQPVGVLSVNELGKYGSENEDGRYLLSVYGNLFDVSDRPDKYGPDGPYASLTGKDLTWGLFTGVDTEDFCNKFYDLFKAKDMGKDKLAGLCSWWAWYESEYGKPVGLLEPFTRERELPAPPLEEVQDVCAVM